jgi:hypothetical protein
MAAIGFSLGWVLCKFFAITIAWPIEYIAVKRHGTRLEIAAMSVRRALVLFAALFIGLNPANADNIKFKYLLQCGGAKSCRRITILIRLFGRELSPLKEARFTASFLL